MPREKQKRGRRAEAKAEKSQDKRKRENDVVETDVTKRQKFSTDNPYPQNDGNMGDDYVPLESYPETSADDTPFFGLLDTEEQEYFSQASQTLELNQFQDDEDRALFIDSVFEEANGKELKVACSQSCSRLMEKLIAMASVDQIKRLFNKFSGHFLHLIQHRFASHCCECLFVRAAPIVTLEMRSSKGKKKDEVREEQNGEDIQLRMADLFLGAISELQGNWGYLLTESFASHAIRVLLLILAGEPLGGQSNGNLIASRKKENTDLITTASHLDSSICEKREVPDSFKDTLQKTIKDLCSGLNTTYLRALATHPVGSPVLQVLLSIELTLLRKSKTNDPDSVLRRLIPDDTFEDTETSAFITSLFYDPVGSRLLETLLRCAPGKFFKAFYKGIICDRIGSLSRNEMASYVVIRVLDRLSKENLQDAMTNIIPEIPPLIERSRLNVVRALIDRSVVRGLDPSPVAEALKSAYGDDSVKRLENILDLQVNNQPDIDDTKKTTNASPRQLHGSLLGQSMLQAHGALADMIRAGFLEASSDTILNIAKHPAASRVLQEALTSSKSNTQFRRQIIPKLSGHLYELAIDGSGSHVADILWQATTDLLFLKQRLAEELLDKELELRDSFFGRAVWRNWSMDLYKRKRGEWIAKAKESSDSRGNTIAVEGESTTQKKSKLDLARERFAAREEQQNKRKEQRKSKPKPGSLSGANLVEAK